jgi:hypothetical protein
MKKLWIVTGVIVVLGVVTGGVFFFLQKNTKVISPGETVLSTPTPISAVALTTWDDPAGFSFQYPKDVSVNKHEDDNDNYAHVELTNSSHPGSVIVWVSDLPKGVTTVDSWVTKLYSTATSIDTTLGGIAAKKILVSSPSAKLLVGTISDSLLFYVDGTLTDKAYWQTVEDGIVKTFAFTPDTSASSNAVGSDSVDEEEVVQ